MPIFHGILQLQCISMDNPWHIDDTNVCEIKIYVDVCLLIIYGDALGLPQEYKQQSAQPINTIFYKVQGFKKHWQNAALHSQLHVVMTQTASKSTKIICNKIIVNSMLWQLGFFNFTTINRHGKNRWPCSEFKDSFLQ